MVKPHEGCTARQRADQMACEHGIAWDMDDPSLPECVKREVCPYAHGKVQHPAEWPAPPIQVEAHSEITREMIDTDKGTQPCNDTYTMIGVPGKLDMLPPNYPSTGLRPGLYRTEDRIFVVEHHSGYVQSQNRLYTEYTPSGKRMRQVLAFPTSRKYRYPIGHDWSEWREWEHGMK